MELDRAHALATTLLHQHGLLDWHVRFDRAKTRAGACRPARREISLSGPLTHMHSEEEVTDTILHEIAHALVGREHGHDDVWRAKAIDIGCSGRRCVDADSERLPGAWTGTCPAGHVTHQHRRPTRVTTCAACSDRFDLAHVFTWRLRGRVVAMHPNYIDELGALEAAGSDRIVVRRWVAGTEVRVIAPGRFYGAIGPVVKIGRTRYHLQIGTRIVTVPFSLVEPTATTRRRDAGLLSIPAGAGALRMK